MRLVTWNCQGGFRRKFGLIAGFKPDIAVIQECEHPEKIKWTDGLNPTASAWVGNGPSKGLAVFSWTGAAFSVMDIYDPGIRHCLPLQVSAPAPFTLLAIWAMDHPLSRLSYSAQVYQALATFRTELTGRRCVLMGDFNSSPHSSRSRLGNHATVQTQLEDLWLVSAYHAHYHQKQGEETQATFYSGRNSLRPRHIDYVYLPVAWLRSLRGVRLGDPQVWLQHSDHCPVIVDLDETRLPRANLGTTEASENGAERENGDG